MTTITAAATTITPDLVLGYDVESESRNVLHQILNRVDLDVSLRGEGLRSGTLELFFMTREDAFAAQELHQLFASFQLEDIDAPELDMVYVRVGRMRLHLDRLTRTRWILDVGFQEVLA